MNFQTDRLKVENWTPHLRDEVRRSALETRLSEILTPAVLRHLPPTLQRHNAEPIHAWVQAREDEAEIHLIETRADENVIGLLILAHRGGTPPDIHIGYLFAEEAWGHGYATELVVGLVQATPAPARLLAGVEANNPASARVLEKAGFSRNADDGLYTMLLY